jgi:hypothetical protein
MLAKDHKITMQLLADLSLTTLIKCYLQAYATCKDDVSKLSNIQKRIQYSINWFTFRFAQLINNYYYFSVCNKITELR